MHVPSAQQCCLQQLATPLEYTPTVYPPHTPSPTVYTWEQLLSMKLSPLDPILTSHLRCLRTGFDLPQLQGCRGGRRKHKKIAVINITLDRISRTKVSGVDFTNLISVPLSSDRPYTKKTRTVKVAVFNVRSVGEKSKCSAINDFIVDNDVNDNVLCLTETWLLPRGDEAKCSNMSPPSAGLSASLILHVTMASPLLSPVRLLPFSPSLPTSAFHILHSNCLSWLSPYLNAHCTSSVSTVLLQTRKKQLMDSFFMEQFPDLLEYNNTLKSCSLTVGDFDFHYESLWHAH